MRTFQAFVFPFLFLVLLRFAPILGQAESFERGNIADFPAAEAYASWTQFAVPDTQTPAIDQDGCLNYALAKMAVRYNLPLDGVDGLTDSYTYYTTFVHQLLSPELVKTDHIAEVYSEFLVLTEFDDFSGTISERIQQAYTYCAQTGSGNDWGYILQMTTASGSDHYVLVDTVDTTEQRLYLLDSGSLYASYLGNAETTTRGYCLQRIYAYHFQKVLGDLDGDFRLTQKDALLLWENRETIPCSAGDANHDGMLNLADVIYLAQYAAYVTGAQTKLSFSIEAVPEETIAVPESQEFFAAFSSFSRWNGKIFQKQIRILQ